MSEYQSLLIILKKRFQENMHRHPKSEWLAIEEKLINNPDKLAILKEMEESGGEPDVISEATAADEIVFYDCSKESPAGRRSICYDQAALEARKKHKPQDSALGMAQRMKIELLSVQEYEHLQSLEAFDLKTSSWVMTPASIRELGGALFGDRRYDTVFIYHNGADSYYGARGFRGKLQI